MANAQNDHIEIRAVIKFLVAKGYNAREIETELKNTYLDKAPAYSTVAKWAAEFKRGRTSLFDDPRSGRPADTCTPEIIEAVRKLIEKDPRIKAHELAAIVKLSKTSVLRILHDELNLSKLSARWIPRNLTEAQKRDRVRKARALLRRYRDDPDNFVDRVVTGDEVWLFHWDPESKQESMEWREIGANPPLKARTRPSCGKLMATIFWDSKGVLLVDYLEHGATINAAYYCQLLRNLREAIRRKRHGKLALGILLLHDNARVHTAHTTQAVIRECRFEVLDHPPYSPDMAPSDYYLFRHLKKFLRGKYFEDDGAVADAADQWFSDQTLEFYARGIHELADRWDKCIHNRGEYFEKL